MKSKEFLELKKYMQDGFDAVLKTIDELHNEAMKEIKANRVDIKIIKKEVKANRADIKIIKKEIRYIKQRLDELQEELDDTASRRELNQLKRRISKLEQNFYK